MPSESAVRGRVVYVVTSEGGDFYSAMTRVSIASLRMSNPGIRLTLISDATSQRAMLEKQDVLLEEADEVLVWAVPEGGAAYRNRYCKTRMRLLLDGPFLFLDSDVVVRKSLASVFALRCDVAAAANVHSSLVTAQQMWVFDKGVVKSMGWPVNPQTYCNGGVLFFNETPGARRFAETWHALWLQSFSRHQYYRDQPALNASLLASRAELVLLDDTLNSQFAINTKAAWDAAIWHYYASMNSAPRTAFEVLVGRILQGHPLEERDIRALIRPRHPWRREQFLADLMARRACQAGALDERAKAFFAGEYEGGISLLSGELMRRMRGLFR